MSITRLDIDIHIDNVERQTDGIEMYVLSVGFANEQSLSTLPAQTVNLSLATLFETRLRIFFNHKIQQICLWFYFSGVLSDKHRKNL